jgi:F0F1-type ATP synthase membrane subunit c/vacuolar-type H+-ATPase subunit K
MRLNILWIPDNSPYHLKLMTSLSNSADAKFRVMSRNEERPAKASQLSFLLLMVESVLIFALGIYMVALGFTHDKDWLPYLSVTGFAFVGAVAMFALAQGVKNRKRWANSPAILANLIALGVAKYQFEAGVYFLAVPITAMAITVVVSLVKQISKSS